MTTTLFPFTTVFKQLVHKHFFFLLGTTPIVVLNNKLHNTGVHLFNDNTPLPSYLKALLNYGLNFIPSPSKPTLTQSLLRSQSQFVRNTRFQFQYRYHDRQSFDSYLYIPKPDAVPQLMTPSQEEGLERFYNNIKHKRSILNYDSRKTNLPSAYKQLIKTWEPHPSLLVISTDKNLGPAIINRTLYLSLIQEFINKNSQTITCVNKHTSLTINRNWLKATITRLAHDIHLLLTRAQFNDVDYIIYTLDKNKKLPVLYGLLKVHKPTLSIRPIVPSHNTLITGASKWFTHLLQPYLKCIPSYIKDTYDFKEKLKAVPYNPSDKMVTIDVVSMYTSIDQQHMLTALQWFIHTYTVFPVEKIPLFIQAAHLLLQTSFFEYNGSIYKQQGQGLAMGQNHAPVFAIIYLAYTEQKLCTTRDTFAPYIQLYCRFIDDIFLISKDNTYKKVLNILNTTPGFNYTHELSTQVGISFLDVTVYPSLGKWLTKSYTKPMNKFLHLPFSSAHPPAVRKGIVKSSIQRLRRLNDDTRFYKQAVNEFLRQLLKRGHNIHFLNKLVEQCMKELLHQQRTQAHVTPFPIQVPISTLYLKVPYNNRGLSRTYLKNALDVTGLERALTTKDFNPRVVVCYHLPKKLQALLHNPN